MTIRLLAWSLFVAFFATVQYLNQFLGEKPSEDFAYRWEASVNAVFGVAIFAGLLFLLTLRLDRRQFLALRPPSSWIRAAGISAVVIVAVLVVSAAVRPFTNVDEEQGLVPSYWDPDRAAQFAAFAVAVSVLAPVVEELLFRGVGYGLLERYGQRLAVVVVGIAFALVHGLVEGFPVIAALGTGLAYLRSRTGSIYPCIVLHAGFNATALALGVST